jgi:hypothetical protein
MNNEIKKNIGKIGMRIAAGTGVGILTLTSIGCNKGEAKLATPIPAETRTTNINIYIPKGPSLELTAEASENGTNKAFKGFEATHPIPTVTVTEKPKPTRTTLPTVIPEELKEEYGESISFKSNELSSILGGTVISGDFFVNGHRDYDDLGETGSIVVSYNNNCPLNIRAPYGGSGRTNLQNQDEVNAVIGQQAMASFGSHPEFKKIFVYDAVTGKIIRTITRK